MNNEFNNQPMNNMNQPAVNNQPMNNMNQQPMINNQPMNNQMPFNNMNPNMMGNNQPKKNNTTLIIIIIIAIVAVILGIAIFATSGSDKKDDNKVEENKNQTEKDDKTNKDENNDITKEDDNETDIDYSSGNQELAKNVESNIVNSENGKLAFFAKNNNKESIGLDVVIDFFDANGNKVGSDFIVILELGANGELAEELYTYFEYATYKIEMDVNEIYGDSVYNDVVLTDKKVGNDVVVTVKNNSKLELESADIAVVFYNGDKVVGVTSDYTDEIKPGASEEITIEPPYDKNYDTMTYTSYKVYLNDAYAI